MRSKIITLSIISFLALLWAALWPVGNKLVLGMAYVDIADGTEIRAYKEFGFEGFLEENSNKQRIDGGTAYFNLRWNHDDLTGIMVKPTDGSNPCVLNFVKFYLQHNMVDTPICQWDSSQILENFEIADGDFEIDETGFLRVIPQNENCAIITSSTELFDSIRNTDSLLKHQAKVARVASCVIILALIWMIVLNADSIISFFEKQDIWSLLSILAILVAGIGVWVIAFHSPGGHPDEDDVIKCLNYAMKRFAPPDMRTEDLAYTYSGYGYTKLANGTWYFILAGKIAWLASKLWAGIYYYRVPNVLMFIAMAFIYARQIMRKRWLVFALGISAQAWYIFSYTTADALDFFLCFIAIIVLTDEEGILYKAIIEKPIWKTVWRHALLGVLFGFIFLGKQNYWAVLLLGFIVLLFKLIEAHEDGRRTLLANYGVIVAFFALTVGIRHAFYLYYYGFNMSQVKAEMDVLHAAFDKNPTTPVQDIAVTYRMMRYGHSLPELFMAAPTWFKDTYRSFCGLLQDRVTGDVYFKLMGILYGFVISTLAYFGFRNASPKNKANAVKIGILFAVFIASFLASIINSYVSDSQPQGRYLLPMLFTASYIAYLTPGAFEKKYFKAAIISLQVLSAWYFVTAGVGCFL